MWMISMFLIYWKNIIWGAHRLDTTLNDAKKIMRFNSIKKYKQAVKHKDRCYQIASVVVSTLHLNWFITWSYSHNINYYCKDIKFIIASSTINISFFTYSNIFQNFHIFFIQIIRVGCNISIWSVVYSLWLTVGEFIPYI